MADPTRHAHYAAPHSALSRAKRAAARRQCRVAGEVRRGRCYPKEQEA